MKTQWIKSGLVGVLLLLVAFALFPGFSQAQEEAVPPPEAAGAQEETMAAEAAPVEEAAPPPKIDTGDTAWVLTSSALVLAMTAPGLVLFYGGMVRRKNALGTMMHSFIILCLISVQWVLWGYSLAFGPDKGHIIGGLEWFAPCPARRLMSIPTGPIAH